MYLYIFHIHTHKYRETVRIKIEINTNTVPGVYSLSTEQPISSSPSGHCSISSHNCSSQITLPLSGHVNVASPRQPTVSGGPE